MWQWGLIPILLNPLGLKPIQLNTVDIKSIQLNSLDLKSIQLNPLDLKPIQLNPLDLKPIQLNSDGNLSKSFRIMCWKNLSLTEQYHLIWRYWHYQH